MDKYIYDDKNGLWYELQGGLLYSLPYLTNRRRTDNRHLGTAAFALSERISQAYIYQFAHKRKAERIPCRCFCVYDREIKDLWYNSKRIIF